MRSNIFYFPLINNLIYFISMCDCNPQGLDLKIPRNATLTAFYKRSFAHYTVKKRMPVILTQVIDGLARNKEEIKKEYGDEGSDELKAIIGDLSKLKYEIQTNKPLQKLLSNASDAQFYNNYISTQSDKDGTCTYFSTIWLLSECYMYRRIREAFELKNKMKNYDPFFKQKQQTCFQAIPMMSKLAEYLMTSLEKSSEPNKDEFIKLLKINLWGNKCDLSLSNGVMTSNIEELFNLEKLEPFILCDHSEKVWAAISNGSSIIDIVFDNSGYEVFTDLCLADYFISKKLATTVRLYVKAIPWFLSDVMAHDFDWLLKHLKFHTDEYLNKLGEKWTNYVNNKKWIVIENDFWTLPVDFTYMKTVNPSLYKKMSEAGLIIFKGDLNYRKLFGEKNWDPAASVDDCLQGFHPSKLCALRTVKSDIVCGLPEGVAEKLEAINPKWMGTGDYGLIQFSDKIEPL